jgi:hypothetical protein
MVFHYNNFLMLKINLRFYIFLLTHDFYYSLLYVIIDFLING